MKFIQEKILFCRGAFYKSSEYLAIQTEIKDAIKSIVWPIGSNTFAINPIRHGNGVVPIKGSFISYLRTVGWDTEVKIDVEATVSTPGKIDAVKKADKKYYAVEWETGNISSSHRAINKMAVGILSGKLAGGTLILPTRAFYYYLTDRIGNFSELAPYFKVWEAINCTEGIITVIAVEHDILDENVPQIQKGTDGRARV